jgi:enoyl-CoA hydratase/carnithine racemase
MPVHFSEIEPRLAIIQFDRPVVRNGLNWEAMDKFATLIQTAHQNLLMKGLILTGIGETFPHLWVADEQLNGVEIF